MTAAAGYWPQTKCLDALAWLPGEPNLMERGTADSVGDIYVRMFTEGSLRTDSGLVVSPSNLLDDALLAWGPPAVIVADRYREGELRQALADSKVPPCPLVLRGQGWRDGSEDVRRFRTRFMSGNVAPVRSLLLRSAVGSARVVRDVAGNEKLAKGSEGGRSKTARDDAAAAAILAVAEADRRGDVPNEPGFWSVVAWIRKLWYGIVGL